MTKAHIANAHEFYGWLSEPLIVSGSHGIGIGDLLNEIIKNLPEDKDELEEEQITFCVVDDQMLVNLHSPMRF